MKENLLKYLLVFYYCSHYFQSTNDRRHPQWVLSKQEDFMRIIRGFYFYVFQHKAWKNPKYILATTHVVFNYKGYISSNGTVFCVNWPTREAWCSNTFASHLCGLGLTLTLGCMWDVFHPSQPMSGGFPLGVFFHTQKGSKLFCLELSHKASWPGQNSSGWRKINGFTELYRTRRGYNGYNVRATFLEIFILVKVLYIYLCIIVDSLNTSCISQHVPFLLISLHLTQHFAWWK